MKRPNFLVLLSDQHRGDWLGADGGYPVRTPQIDAMGRRGVRFSHCWTPSPLCAPARTCLATGLDYGRSPVRHNRDDMSTGQDTFYRRLAADGYRLRSVGKLDLLKGAMDWGLDGRHTLEGISKMAELGFDGGADSAGKHDALRGYEMQREEPYFAALASRGLADIHHADYARREPAEYDVTIGQAQRECADPPPAYANTACSPLPDDLYCDNWVAQRGIEQLEDLCRQSQPWLLLVNFSGPHEPLDVTTSMRAAWQGIAFPPPQHVKRADAGLHQHIRQNYAAMIEVIDTWCGRFVSTVERCGQSSSTMVVYTSDHGEMLGDFNLWGKSVPFEPAVRIPLVVSGPMISSPGRVVADPVSWIDLAATCLDFAGCESPSATDALSFRPCLSERGTPLRRHVFSGLGNWRAVSDGRFKLVAGYRTDVVAIRTQYNTFDPACIEDAKLYDTRVDLWDANDLSSAHPNLRQTMARVLADDCARGPMGPL